MTMRFTQTGAALALAAMVSGLAAGGAEAAGPARVLAKAGGSYDERVKDIAQCRAIADAAPEGDLPQTGERASASGYAADLPTALGGAIAFALIAAIDTSRARGKARAFCLLNLGYAPVPLTPEEDQAYQKLSDDKRDAWERTFLTQDLTARVSALTTATAPPLPPYRVEPGAQGGVKLDLASLAIVPAAATGGEAGAMVITGKLTRSRTAVLQAPFKASGGAIEVAGEAGAVFHQVDYRPQRAWQLRDQGSTWCGPVLQTAAGGGPASPQVYCFTTHPDGYDAFRPSGYDWLAGPYRDGFILARTKGPILLKERDSDDVAPFDLQIRLGNVMSSHMVVVGMAVRGDHVVGLWWRDLRFDAAGKAVLPLWSRRAVFTRSGPKSVSVTLEDGDGHGWRDGDE